MQVLIFTSPMFLPSQFSLSSITSNYAILSQDGPRNDEGGEWENVKKIRLQHYNEKDYT